MKKRNQRGTNYFLDLLMMRERHRPETRRLVIRLHMAKNIVPVSVPIHFLRHSLSGN